MRQALQRRAFARGRRLPPIPAAVYAGFILLVLGKIREDIAETTFFYHDID